MKNLTLVERIEDDDKIIIKYSFGDIIIEYRYYNDNTPSLTFQKGKKSEWIVETYISDYNKVRLMSGIEELAKEALQDYHKTMAKHAEFCQP